MMYSVINGTLDLAPYLPYQNLRWFNIYGLPSTLQLEKQHPQLSDAQLIIGMWILQTYNSDIAKVVLSFLPMGYVCYDCKKCLECNAFDEIMVKLEQFSVCQECWKKRDHYTKMPGCILDIMNLNLKHILPISRNRYVTHIVDIQYVGKIQKHYIFCLVLPHNQTFHVLFDHLGYLVALEIGQEWTCISDTEAIPVLTNLNFLETSIRGMDWLVNKRRFGFL